MSETIGVILKDRDGELRKAIRRALDEKKKVLLLKRPKYTKLDCVGGESCKVTVSTSDEPGG